MVPKAPFSASRRGTCESAYVGLSKYTSQCVYSDVGDGDFKCILEWPPYYPCEEDTVDEIKPPAPTMPPPPSPLPPPPPSGGSDIGSDCGLDQPYTMTKSNLWDRQLWCGQVVRSGEFDQANRDTCERFYVGRPDYSAECTYVVTSGSTYECKLKWPPFYPCS
eukprot:scaffold109299_cov32-Tisochrysis_lutea.AAC.2